MNTATEEDAAIIDTHNTRTSNLRPRKLDDVDYWRKKAGWYDDDVSMKNYNSGVMDSSSAYGFDDDYSGGSSSATQSSNLFNMSDLMTTAAQIFGAFVALAILIMIIRAMGKGRKRNKKRRSKDDRSRKSSRSRSKSRARSKSRTRSKSKKRSEGDDDYHLMGDDKSHRSGKSGRSSRSKSRSKSRSRKDRKVREEREEAVLV